MRHPLHTILVAFSLLAGCAGAPIEADETAANAPAYDPEPTDDGMLEPLELEPVGEGASDVATEALLATRPPSVFGVTITDPWAAESSTAVLTALDGLRRSGGRLPTARVVFDEGVDRVFRSGGTAADYVAPVRAIGAHARVMGELLDSYYVPDYTVAQLRRRACEYRATLGHLVDVWEVGNEVNGEWLLASGEAQTVVVDKIVAVVQVFEADATRFAQLCPGFTRRTDERPFELALTAYGNGTTSSATSCWARSAHQMESWLARHFGAGGRGAAVRDSFDYVWVSYYEDDCENLQPNWPAVFDRLGTIFPVARLGFGECGTDRLASRASYVARYYAGMDSIDTRYANMRITHPRYVGGMFWWYYSRDFTNSAVQTALRATLASPFWSR
jgi:hypothetical protein